MTVRIDHDGPVTIVAIDRPAKRNAVDPLTALALREAFTAFAKDDNARAVLYTNL
ncbi:MAG: enoyl-CoA hydratase, partial [Sphingopyxis sp.]|nr:enoyl-CoA hydratase [Sphingopyxis sp.]